MNGEELVRRALEDALSRLPIDDSYRHGLLGVRKGPRMRLGQDPLSEAPAPLAQVLALSELDARRRRKQHQKEGES